jgi:hypothetical protein
MPAVQWRAAAVVGLLASCNRDPEIVQRPVVVYSPKSCPVPADAFSVMYAGGDFDNPQLSSQKLSDIGREMPALPATTRSLVVDVSGGEIASRGVATVAGEGPTNVLVWRASQACDLTENVGPRTDMAFGVFGPHFMIVGGKATNTPATYVGDLSTGAIQQLPFGLKTSRIRPTVTPFGDGALVAGGESASAPLDSAEVYSARLGDFEPASIGLAQERMKHGAVQLGTGETLLVGGRDRNGLLGTMEVIDPVSRRTRTARVANLAVPRESPTVLRLANGEILVAGGFDANGKAIPTLEWFSRDVSVATKRAVDLVTGKERAFVPLEGGGALAVIRPDTPTPDFKTVWIISADGTLEPATALDPLTLDRVRLFRGGDGAPILWTGNRWLKWSPWTGEFVLLDVAPSEGPMLDAIDNGDSGLALWMKERGADDFAVAGFRFNARTPFDSVQNPLIERGPLQLVPDRLVSGTIRFDARGIVLDPGASAFVSNVTFADFVLDVEVTATAPIVVVRDDRGAELEVGGASCGFGQSATRSLHVVRKGARVDVSADGGAARTCPTPLADGVRVSLGMRGAQGSVASAARNLRITR